MNEGGEPENLAGSPGWVGSSSSSSGNDPEHFREVLQVFVQDFSLRQAAGETKIREIERQLRDTTGELHLLRHLLEDYQTRINEDNALIHRLQHEIEGLQGRVRGLDQRNNQTEARSSRLEVRLEHLKDCLAQTCSDTHERVSHLLGNFAKVHLPGSCDKSNQIDKLNKQNIKNKDLGDGVRKKSFRDVCVENGYGSNGNDRETNVTVSSKAQEVKTPDVNEKIEHKHSTELQQASSVVDWVQLTELQSPPEETSAVNDNNTDPTNEDDSTTTNECTSIDSTSTNDISPSTVENVPSSTSCVPLLTDANLSTINNVNTTNTNETSKMHEGSSTAVTATICKDNSAPLNSTSNTTSHNTQDTSVNNPSSTDNTQTTNVPILEASPPTVTTKEDQSTKSQEFPKGSKGKNYPPKGKGQGRNSKKYRTTSYSEEQETYNRKQRTKSWSEDQAGSNWRQPTVSFGEEQTKSNNTQRTSSSGEGQAGSSRSHQAKNYDKKHHYADTSKMQQGTGFVKKSDPIRKSQPSNSSQAQAGGFNRKQRTKSWNEQEAVNSSTRAKSRTTSYNDEHFQYKANHSSSNYSEEPAKYKNRKHHHSYRENETKPRHINESQGNVQNHEKSCSSKGDALQVNLQSNNAQDSSKNSEIKTTPKNTENESTSQSREKQINYQSTEEHGTSGVIQKNNSSHDSATQDTNTIMNSTSGVIQKNNSSQAKATQDTNTIMNSKEHAKTSECPPNSKNNKEEIKCSNTEELAKSQESAAHTTSESNSVKETSKDDERQESAQPNSTKNEAVLQDAAGSVCKEETEQVTSSSGEQSNIPNNNKEHIAPCHATGSVDNKNSSSNTEENEKIEACIKGTQENEFQKSGKVENMAPDESQSLEDCNMASQQSETTTNDQSQDSLVEDVHTAEGVTTLQLDKQEGLPGSNITGSITATNTVANSSNSSWMTQKKRKNKQKQAKKEEQRKLAPDQQETRQPPVVRRPMLRMEGGEEQEPEVGMCANCGFLAKMRCASCRQAFYCKRECQRDHWKKGHKDQCLPFQILESTELGRYMVASRDLRAGDVILREDPAVVGPKQITEPICLGCYKKVDGSYRCQKCEWPMCGPSCEKAADHQPECVVGQEIGSPIEISDFDQPNHFYEVIFPLRCLALKKRSPKKYEQLLTLESHYEDRKGTHVHQENQKSIINFLRNYFFIQTFPPEDIDSSEKSIHNMTGIIDVNALELRLQDSEVLGLYPTFAMLEHSCTPNTKHTFNKQRQVVLKAAVDIKRGEHLSTMYTHILWGTSGRRDHLKHSKYFMCTCFRCSDPTELGTHFSALRCKSCSNGFLLSAAPLDEMASWICTSCNATLTGEEVTQINLKLGEEVEEALKMPSVKILEELILRHSKSTVHPNHFHLFAARHTLLQMYGRDPNSVGQDSMKKKEKLSQDFLKVCTALDPGMSRLAPYAGVALYEYHLAVMSRARQDPEAKQVDGAALRKDVETAKALLQQCIRVLQDEPEDQPEGALCHIAQQNLAELRQWEATLAST